MTRDDSLQAKAFPMKHADPKPTKTPQQITEDIKKAAREAPPVIRHEQSMRAIIREVADELEVMRKERGYSMQALSDFLKGKGVPIAAPTLATYLRTFREEKASVGADALERGEGAP